MNERELDRAIDAAAGALMHREPSRALGHNVMARVREGAAPASRRLVWIAAPASIVLCVTIVTALVMGPVAVVPRVPAAPSVAIGQPPVTIAPLTAVASETAAPRRIANTPIAAQTASASPLPLNDVSPIEPIVTEPITLSAIEVPQLERETAVVDVLAIERLTIEPLSTSND